MQKGKKKKLKAYTLYLFRDGMIEYVENLKESTQKKLLEIQSEFSKVTELKVSIQNSTFIFQT